MGFFLQEHELASHNVDSLLNVSVALICHFTSYSAGHSIIPTLVTR